jgi:hypothetical protein
MRTAFAAFLGVAIILVVGVQSRGEESKYPKAAPAPACTDGPVCEKPCSGPGSSHWTNCCYPRSGCPDDYCPNSYPRQCWLPYPSYYKCVPAGACSRSDACAAQKDKRSWWFVPTPQALRDALWFQP